MKIEIWCIGKSKEKYLLEAQEIYLKRLKHYAQISWEEFKEPKTSSKMAKDVKKSQSKFILDKVKSNDILILLDEKGKHLSSVQFSKQISTWQNSGVKKIIFVIGGAFGFDNPLYDRANYLLSLSKMTFTHLMIRIIFLEQLYRAFTILKGEKYHNQ